jgi:hypothetical protein
MERQGIDPVIPAFRILIGAPAVGRALRAGNQRPGVEELVERRSAAPPLGERLSAPPLWERFAAGSALGERLSAAPLLGERLPGSPPQRNTNFTGRDDILAQLRPATSRKVTAVLPGDPLPRALQGLGGVGKTAVAIEYAYRYRSEYDLVWWIPADQAPLVRSSLAGLADRLGLQSAAAASIDAAAAAVLDALRRGDPYSRWLLIFDNADQPEDLRDVIPDGPGDVLITSRNPRWRQAVETVWVDAFTRAESTEFLARRAPEGMSQAEASQLAAELGDLPLALGAAATCQADSGMSAGEYLRVLKEQPMLTMAEGKPSDYPWSPTVAWERAVTSLYRQLPEAVELLRCFAFFGPEPIPSDLFRRAVEGTGEPLKRLTANPILLARAVRELGRFALVKIDRRTIVVNPLIQVLQRDELGPDWQARYRHDVHLILAAGARGNPDDTALWPRYAELAAHAASPAMELARCQDPRVRACTLDIVRYFHQSGDRRWARSFTEQLSRPGDPCAHIA